MEAHYQYLVQILSMIVKILSWPNLHHESKVLDMRKQTICILFKKEISGEVLNEVDIIFIPFLPKQA